MLILDSISTKNFKSLSDASFKFKPITLLIGANNSGKSSFISLLLTLKQTLASRNMESPFVLEGPYVQLGSFSRSRFRS
jgi:AAA15 family ATPase/GTPase